MTIMDLGKTDQRYHVHIDANPPLLDLRLHEIWQYRDFIYIFTKNQFIRRYKQTILGPIWLLINPVLQSLINLFLFGIVVGVDTNGIPSLLFYMASNGIWTFFSTVFNMCAHTFSRNEHLFGKVRFPRLAVPTAYLLMSAIEFLGGYIIFLLISLYYLRFNYAIHLSGVLIIPVILLWLGCMALGFGIIFSSLTAKYRDLNILIEIAFRLWMYATPIVYPLSQIKPGLLHTLISLNPVTPVIEIYRRLLFEVGEINTVSLTVSILFTIVILFSGLVFFSRIEKNFMDTV